MIFATRLKSIFSLHYNMKLLPSNNIGNIWIFADDTEKYVKKHVKKVC